MMGISFMKVLRAACDIAVTKTIKSTFYKIVYQKFCSERTYLFYVKFRMADFSRLTLTRNKKKKKPVFVGINKTLMRLRFDRYLFILYILTYYEH